MPKVLLSAVIVQLNSKNIKHVHSRVSLPNWDSIHRGSNDWLSSECEADALPPSHHSWIFLWFKTVQTDLRTEPRPNILLFQ